jgi:two-component system KDP operon response regulator KdpE
MAHIRKKLERDPSHPVHFLTDSGVGYRFEPGTRA